jgi:hypothetical protein
MKFEQHGNGNGLDDLYVLPESDEWGKVIDYLDANGIRFTRSFSDVQGQDWYGKQFIEIPFRCDLREALEAL